jgi:hypothetical protein
LIVDDGMECGISRYRPFTSDPLAVVLVFAEFLLVVGAEGDLHPSTFEATPVPGAS